MPVEIRELVIRTNVVDSNASTSQEGTPQAETLAALKAQIIAECVRETLGVLKKKEER